MNEVVLNKSHYSFIFSYAALDYLYKNYSLNERECYKLKRHDVRIVDCVKKLNTKASYGGCNLIVEQFNDDKYYIRNYDNYETLFTDSSINWIYIN